MRRIAATAIVMGAMIGIAAPSAAAAAPRALWVWDGPDAGALAVATQDGFDVLFVHAPPGFEADSYRSFVDQAHASGIQVYAMAGDPAWTTEKNSWRNWVKEVEAAGVFDGAVADVEPYLLPGWSDPGAQRGLISNYLRRLSSAAKEAKTIDLVVAVPFWWDLPEFERRGETLVERVYDKADGVVVMAYRDTAGGDDGIIAHAGFEVAQAAAAGKYAWVGVETAPAGLDKVSFAEEGRTYMAGELTEVDGAFGAGYAGVAVHHYGSWLSLGG